MKKLMICIMALTSSSAFALEYDTFKVVFSGYSSAPDNVLFEGKKASKADYISTQRELNALEQGTVTKTERFIEKFKFRGV